MKVTILAVGRLRPPYVDDVAHYLKMLGRYATVEVVEVREDDDVARRIPERAFVVLLAADGRQLSSEAFAAWLQERRVRGAAAVLRRSAGRSGSTCRRPICGSRSAR